MTTMRKEDDPKAVGKPLKPHGRRPTSPGNREESEEGVGGGGRVIHEKREYEYSPSLA